MLAMKLTKPLTPGQHLLILTGLALFSCVAIGQHGFLSLFRLLQAESAAPYIFNASIATGLVLPFLLIHFFWLRLRRYTVTPGQAFYFSWLLAPLSLIPVGFYYLFLIGNYLHPLKR